MNMANPHYIHINTHQQKSLFNATPIILYTKGRLLLLLFIRDGKDGFVPVFFVITSLPLVSGFTFFSSLAALHSLNLKFNCFRDPKERKKENPIPNNSDCFLQFKRLVFNPIIKKLRKPRLLLLPKTEVWTGNKEESWGLNITYIEGV